MADGMDNPPRDAGLPAGYDEHDPYEDEDLDDYPAWWRENIQEFRDHDMRPYRPPRFSDGELVPEIVLDCEAELGVDVGIRAVNPELEEDWELQVADTTVTTVGRHRDGDGVTIYEMTSDDFIAVVEEAARTE